MMRILAIIGTLAVIGCSPALADSHEPTTKEGMCAKANGGHWVEGTPHMWRTLDADGWNKCMNTARSHVSHDPHTLTGKCAKATGGHWVVGTPHKWQTYNFDAWNKCVQEAGLREAYGSMRTK